MEGGEIAKAIRCSLSLHGALYLFQRGRMRPTYNGFINVADIARLQQKHSISMF
jgi:hypothetical protein